MTLKLKGKTLFKYKVGKPGVWWMNSFDPSHQDARPRNLTATYTVNMASRTGLFNGLTKMTGEKRKYWKFTKSTYTAVLTFCGEEGVHCAVNAQSGAVGCARAVVVLL
ncbi:MAG: hypothetical protein LBK28_02595 [Propionibacteriaceae bacterium]|nr:hypothetical protein [Propionibacteriaceae bacterium]